MDNNLTRDIVLPSRGLLNANIPGGKVTQRCMMVRDQKYLSGSSSADNGITRLLQDTIVSPSNIKVADLSIPDTMYLLMSLRSFSYGDVIKFEYRCPHCRELTKVSVDISKIDVYDLYEGYQEDMSVELPHSGDTVYTRFLRNRDLDEVRETVQKLRDSSEDGEIDEGIEYVLRLSRMIEKIKLKEPDADGETVLTDPIDIRKYVEKMTDYDASAITATVDSIEFGIAPDYPVTCTHCKQSFRAPIMIDYTFFRPKFEIKHKRTRRK